MKSWKPRAQAHRRTIDRTISRTANPTGSRTIQSAGEQATDDVPVLPPAVKDWLARLFLLYGVPFEYLVPDYRMLPAESIRWAFVDINWLERAMDGAMSIGRTGSQDMINDAAVRTSLVDAILAESRHVRAQLRGEPVAPENADARIGPDGKVAVMLIRSAVVGGYPGMEVKGLAGDGSDIALLRMDQLSIDVLLVMFETLPAEVQLIEPSEGLHFGIRYDNVTPCAGGAELDDQPLTLVRSLQTGQIGEQLMDSDTAVESQVFFRDDDDTRKVLDLDRTLSELQCWLEKKDGRPAGQALSPAEFAVQMLRAPGLQRFVPDAPPDAPDAPDMEENS